MATILVVDDEPKIARLLRDYLERAGLASRSRMTAARRSSGHEPSAPTSSSSTSACRPSTGST